MILRLYRSLISHRLVRFLLIGGTSFVLYDGLYLLFSRVLWTSGNRTLENVVANGIASYFNFLWHRSWTFGSTHPLLTSFSRYLLVLGSAFLLQACLFWTGYAYFHWDDRLVAIGIALMIPFYTYVMHSKYTFLK